MTQFSNLTIDYRQMLGVTIQDRVQLARSPVANEIFGNMTPTEIAKLFPTYYQKNDTGVQSILGATSGFNTASNRPGAPSNGSGGSGSGGTGTVKQITPLTVSQLIAVEASMSKPGKDARIAGTDGLQRGRQQNIKAVYDAYVSAGLSHKQALAFTAEVGRENGYNPDLMFGTHTDLNGQTNIGMVSMQRDRRLNLQEFLAKEGLLDAEGKMIPGQATLNAQARFQVMEIKEKYPKTAEQFLANPDIDAEEAAVILGDDYIRWARKGNPRIGFSAEDAARHDEHRRRNYEEAKSITENFQLRSDYEQENLNKAEPAEPILKITPENISTIHGLDPRLIDYANTLSGEEKSNFFDGLNNIKNVERINKVSKEGLDRIKYTPQGTATPMSEDPLNEDPYEFWSARNPRGAALEVDGQPIDRRTMLLNMMAAKRFEADNPGKRVEIYGSSGGVRDEYSGSQHAKNNRTALDIAIYQLDENGNKINMGGPNDGNIPNAPFGVHGNNDSWNDNAHLYNQYGENVEMARVYQSEVLQNPDYQNFGVTMGEYFPGSMTGDSMHNDIRGTFGVDSETGISQSGYDAGSVAYGWNENALSNMGYDLNTPEAQEMLTGLAEKYPTREAVTDAARKMYEPQPLAGGHPNVKQLDDGTLIDYGVENLQGIAEPAPAPTANTVPVTSDTAIEPLPQTATPAPETPNDVPKLAQGGFIPQKDDLQVTDTKTGETVAMINNGEVEKGIVPKGSGVEVQSNEKVNAQELAAKYEDEPEPEPQNAPQINQSQIVQQGSMTSPASDSQSNQNIGHIPYQSTMDLVHNSLLRAYDLDRRRTGYGNIS